MPWFRKKPVAIEARQFLGSWASAQPILEWIKQNKSLETSEARWADGAGYPGPEPGTIHIPMSEGVMEASAGDWIIMGVAGEFYPCKPHIFAATYDPV